MQKVTWWRRLCDYLLPLGSLLRLGGLLGRPGLLLELLLLLLLLHPETLMQWRREELGLPLRLLIVAPASPEFLAIVVWLLEGCALRSDPSQGHRHKCQG